MDYEQFKVYMKESVETVTGRKVTVHPLLHNNSLVRDSLSIDTPLGAPAGPAPVLWDYYQQYEKGASPGMLVNDVIRACEDRNRQLQVNPDLLQDFSQLKNRICARLVSRERNGELLKRAPHRGFLDLEIIYYVLFSEASMGMLSMRVENTHLHMWGVTGEAVYEAAMKNTPRLLPYRLHPMQALLEQMEKTEAYRHLKEEERRAVALARAREDMPLYVLTNTRGFYGASAILYEGLLEQCVRKFPGDVFVIPSSVHELLLVSAEDVWSAQEMTEMIRCVNQTGVAPEEILSDHVYIYRKNLGKLTM